MQRKLFGRILSGLLSGAMLSIALPVTALAEEYDLPLLSAKTAAYPIAINEENFPGTLFREYITQSLDPDNDGVLSEEEIAAVKEITVSDADDLSGIEFFTALEKLDCTGSAGLTSVELGSNINLTTLVLHGANITTLNLSALTALKTLDCSGCSLSELILSRNTQLTSLNCSHNSLDILDLSGLTNLKELDCSYNNLESKQVDEIFV